MNSKTTITMANGIKIATPSSLNVLTTFVLQEQGDWFEDEIDFVRLFLEPGQEAIDIGANYGVYTLNMANRVGSAGRVWAFEPASTTAAFLRDSVAVNGFDHVVVEQAALSDKVGSAQLALNESAELNELVRGEEPLGRTETVSVRTLDEYVSENELGEVAFVKLDAEGEEANILRGGSNFFDQQSPLVLYEVKAGNDLHLGLVNDFSDLGYRTYRLVPGLNVLVPFDENETVDPFLLNLFSCKPDRATQLANRGLLVAATTVLSASEAPTAVVGERGDSEQSADWLDALVQLPYGKHCEDQWRRSMESGGHGEVATALADYLRSIDGDLSAAERYSALRSSYVRIKSLCDSQPRHLRGSSLARIARDYGARSVAVQALGELCNEVFQRRQADVSEPFLAPGKRFDSVPPRDSMPLWVGAAALEELERNSHFSSFFTDESAVRRLTMLEKMGFASDEMKKRLDLTQQRFRQIGG